MGPGQSQPLNQIAGRGVGHDVEEEVQARVSGGEERRREIFGETLRWFPGEVEIERLRDGGIRGGGLDESFACRCSDVGGFCGRSSGGEWTEKRGGGGGHCSPETEDVGISEETLVSVAGGFRSPPN